MKKPILVVFGILLLAFISVYFIIPQKIITTHIIEVDATDANVAKFLVNKRPWAKWWPGRHNATDSSSFMYNGLDFVLQKNTNGSIEVLIDPQKLNLDSKITYLASGAGACKVTWVTQKQSELNPISRVAEFIKIKKETKNIDSILAGFKKFMQLDSNVYGITVKTDKVKYPVVIASTTNTNNYPSVKIIYGLINGLKKQIINQNAIVLDSPMLNISPIEKGYQVMVAIPVDREIRPDKNSTINRLVKGGNLLVTQVKGGWNNVDNAFTQLKKYQEDRGLRAPAMPYGLLLTNRLAEPDSTKWVTRIFYPSY